MWLRSWPGSAWLAVMAVGFGAMMSQVDSSIVTLAYPTLQRHFDVSLGAVSWVGLAYMLTTVSTLVLLGRISDMVGRKLIYTYGFFVFLLGSLLCGFAPSLTVLVASRVLQAIGGAMLQANSVAIVVLSVPVGSRTKALGFQAAAQATGLALGPTLGGLMLGVVSWRWLFLVNIPLGLIGLPAALYFIPRSRYLAPTRPLDWGGVALLFVAVAGLVGSLSFAKTFGWGSPLIVGGFMVSVASGIWFYLHEQRTTDPLVTPLLLRSPVIRRGLGAALISYLVLFALLFLVPFEIERGLDRGTAIAGLTLLSLPLAIAVTAPFAGRVARWVGNSRALLLASGVAACGVVAVARSGVSLTVMALGLGLTGVGIGLYNTVNNASVMSAVPVQETGVGSGMLNMSRGIGTALGLAAGGALFVGLGGGSQIDHVVRSAFSDSAWVLVALCLVAGILGSSGASAKVARQPVPE
jgi:EmrB/QacA subfamily drug resistance transporter